MKNQTFIAPNGVQVTFVVSDKTEPASYPPEWEIWLGSFTAMGMEGMYTDPQLLGKYKGWSFLDAVLKWWKGEVKKYGSWEAADDAHGGFSIDENNRPHLWGIGLYDNKKDASKH